MLKPPLGLCPDRGRAQRTPSHTPHTPLRAQGRNTTGESVRELTRKQLQDVCAALEAELAAALEALLAVCDRMEQAGEDGEAYQAATERLVRARVSPWRRGASA